MKETTNTSLFTELTAEESATVNGGHYYSSYNCYKPRRRRQVVYRRNCDGSFRAVYRYYYS
ncbi:hypothetical protein QT972_26295 [Microcoleus sp. herbarium7]|uniref:hypothetical protein n=1 Tax=Microcoleus sp. herbarium7 TaxID=3055435 RepID=UPI002FD6CFFA